MEAIKRFFLKILVGCLFLTGYLVCENGATVAYAAETDEATISRGECIKVIMQIIGISETEGRYKNNTFYQVPIFWDVKPDTENAGYIYYAGELGIAKGICEEEPPFEPYRAITTRECLAFMMRCLKSNEEVIWEQIPEQAQRMGLISEEELVTLSFDKAMTGEQFEKIVVRFVEQKRHVYWPREWPPNYAPKSVAIDEMGEMTYCEWYKFVHQKDFLTFKSFSNIEL